MDPTATPATAPAASAVATPVAPVAAVAAAPVAAPAAKTRVTTPGRHAAFARPAVAAAPIAAAPAPDAPKAAPARSNIPVRIANELAALKLVAADVKAYQEALAPIAKAELAGLSESMRKGIVKKVGDDPRKQIAYLNELREMGAVPVAAAPSPTARPAAATTSASPLSAPAPGSSVDADVATFNKHEKLSKTSPQVAAAMMLDASVRAAIYRGRDKAAARN